MTRQITAFWLDRPRICGPERKAYCFAWRQKMARRRCEPRAPRNPLRRRGGGKERRKSGRTHSRSPLNTRGSTPTHVRTYYRLDGANAIGNSGLQSRVCRADFTLNEVDQADRRWRGLHRMNVCPEKTGSRVATRGLARGEAHGMSFPGSGCTGRSTRKR